MVNRPEQSRDPNICIDALRFEPYNTVFIDVDSCLSSVEGIDELAMMRGKYDAVGQLTEEVMNGMLPFDAVFAQRLAIISPERHDLDKLARLYQDTLAPGAQEAVQLLHQQRKQVFLLSGGYKETIDPVAHTLGIPADNVYANTLHFTPEGQYAGYDLSNPLCRQGGKREVIEELRRQGKIFGKVVIIGDGMSEVEAKGAVDLCVGFGGFAIRERVVAEADIYVREQTLTPLIPIALGPDVTLQVKNEHQLLVQQGVISLKNAHYNANALCYADEVRDFARDNFPSK